MNRKNLTSAVLAGLAGVAGIAATAQAVNLNPDGLGQVLIYPYYTVNEGNLTLLSVVNTTENAKAVKVRFLEGQNTREVLDFNLYLSAYDVWVAAITNDDGTPTLEVNDTSCTVPYLYGMGGKQAFLPYALNDGGSTDISRAAEGHFEMIEMGTLMDPDFGSATAATHVDGVPDDCDQLVDAWSIIAGVPGYWLVDPTYDMYPPSGGLFGGAGVINPAAGAMVSYDAQAINGWNATGLDLAGVSIHAEPGFVEPSLNSGDVLDAFVFLEDGTVQASAGLTRSVDAVSFLFMRDQLMNEWTVEAGINAHTEWVVTFPTKHFYVYQPSSASATPLAPFTNMWDPVNTDGACEVVSLDTIWDREEGTLGDVPPGDVPPIVSPAPPQVPGEAIIPFELCYETSVIAFTGGDEEAAPVAGHVSPLLGSSNFHTIDVDTELFSAENGWARLQLDNYPHDANGDGVIDASEADLSRDHLGGLEGLPVTGFAVQAYQNNFLGDGADVLANYSGLFQHKYTRKSSAAASSSISAQ